MSQHIFPGWAKMFSGATSPPATPGYGPLPPLVTGPLTYPGPRWHVLTVRDPQIVRDQKKFGNHWGKVLTPTRNALDFKHASQ